MMNILNAKEISYFCFLVPATNRKALLKSIHLTLALQACLILMEAYDQTHCILIMQH